MKICINSTFSYIKFNLNYGSALQCYALQKYLKGRGHEVSLLRDYRANPVHIIRRLRNVSHFPLFWKKAKSIVQLQGFIRRHLMLSKNGYISESGLVKRCPEADCHIVGSDQVWRNTNRTRYLTYVQDETLKLSYAASFGKADISEETKTIIKPYLERFHGISVRESSGVQIISSMGMTATHVLDPTLLLDWEQYPYQENNQEDYYYCYFLNLSKREDVPYDIIKQISNEDGKKLFLTAPLDYPLFNEESPCFPTVSDWLGYYKNADCIFTNTYHGLLFCIIFRKTFVFFLQKVLKTLKTSDSFQCLKY